MADLDSIPVTISAESLRALMADALELQDERRANEQLAEQVEIQRRRAVDLRIALERLQDEHAQCKSKLPTSAYLTLAE
jgi:hypothetical protein